MATVYYDGEEVAFEGNAPESLSSLLEILRSNAITQQRALVSFKVDDVEAIEEQIDLSGNSYQKVEAQTIAQAELFAKAIDRVIGQQGEPEEQINDILNVLLTEEWTVGFNKLNDFLQQLSAYFELLANLSFYGQTNNRPWVADFLKDTKRMEDSFQHILKYCERQDVSSLCAELSEKFQPIYIANLDRVKGPIKADFTA